ncbi:MAG: hypothetical protein A3F46_01720 [Legionellales bacterium RIFCSPHIGHO2_12_FULL_42_9]|nr:MAG: hypothetical protein A3F46_01720 [Legionellales bacterium RIFCSPHIGHO2_12_FULL_42_9]
MRFSELLKSAGEHRFFFNGADGLLEGCLLVPDEIRKPYVAILGHPHSLQGGSMNNKVVTTMARALRELHIPSLRFNFRGVENSEGEFDNGIGESADMLCLARMWADEVPRSKFIFAGFSFGAYVTYRAAAQWPHELLISVAPAVDSNDYTCFAEIPPVWHILQGDNDEVVPLDKVLAFAARCTPTLPVHRFPDTGHFFHGKLLLLKEKLMSIITGCLSSRYYRDDTVNGL